MTASTPATAPRPRRSVLYMPGVNARALEKARSLGCDAVIFDLEDAVAPDAKDAARETVAAALTTGGYGHRERIVRINGLDTPWGGADLAAAVAMAPDAILVPKVNDRAEVARLSAALDAAGAPSELALWVMIETPLAILNLRDIAAQAPATRLSAFVMGINDLAKDMRAEQTPGREAFVPALALAVTAARAYGLTVIDGVWNALDDAGGFAATCQQGRSFGFDGKTLIHPNQIEVCNATFTPAEAEVAQARAVIAAFAEPENAGKGVLRVNGRMAERLHLIEAQRLVAVADAIAALRAASAQVDTGCA
jgi:citrate lyase subunit beta/citryl-CoA lyase